METPAGGRGRDRGEAGVTNLNRGELVGDDDQGGKRDIGSTLGEGGILQVESRPQIGRRVGIRKTLKRWGPKR
jgi:hypothetical protein